LLGNNPYRGTLRSSKQTIGAKSYRLYQKYLQNKEGLCIVSFADKKRARLDSGGII
jgi:hypothetical protein